MTSLGLLTLAVVTTLGPERLHDAVVAAAVPGCLLVLVVTRLAGPRWSAGVAAAVAGAAVLLWARWPASPDDVRAAATAMGPDRYFVSGVVLVPVALGMVIAGTVIVALGQRRHQRRPRASLGARMLLLAAAIPIVSWPLAADFLPQGFGNAASSVGGLAALAALTALPLVGAVEVGLRAWGKSGVHGMRLVAAWAAFAAGLAWSLPISAFVALRMLGGAPVGDAGAATFGALAWCAVVLGVCGAVLAARDPEAAPDG